MALFSTDKRSFYTYLYIIRTIVMTEGYLYAQLSAFSLDGNRFKFPVILWAISRHLIVTTSRQRTYNVTWRHVRATFVPVEKQ